MFVAGRRSVKCKVSRSVIVICAFGILSVLSGRSDDLDLSNLPPASKRPVVFARDIKPIFEAKCIQCHGPDKQKSQFRLDQKEAALKGGENHVPDIRPGNSAQSPLIHFVSGLVKDMKMPAKGEPLTVDEIGLLRAWIDQGSAWPEGRPPTQRGPEARTVRWLDVVSG
jgi:mono/diheme cytochrome c family protein